MLSWSESAPPSPPAAPAACIEYRFGHGADSGEMRLHRALPRCDCAGAPGGFRAVVSLALSALDELLAGDPSAGAAALRHFARDPTTAGCTHPLTPHARLALESIRRCPFTDACRAMALTARCHDLLVAFLTAWTEALHPVATIGPEDRLRLAAEILERNLEVPPSLGALAAEAGLSETTLKRGFPSLFGTTVYGYVRRRRMEAARRLLETGAATVLEAATRVGYSNPSNFATAFRHQFGVNPKTFQLRARRAAE